MVRLLLCCCLFLLSFAVSGQNKVPPLDLAKLPGTWVSAEDPKYVVIFTDSTQTDLYEDAVQANLRYDVAEDQLTATDLESKEIYKYIILSLSDKNLTLQFMPRGNLLKFRRKQPAK